MSTTETKSTLKLLYIVNVVVSLILATILSPFYFDLFDDQVAFFKTNNGKILKFLLVTFTFVTVIGLILPSFAAYDETEKALTNFLRSKGIQGAPSFRSV